MSWYRLVDYQAMSFQRPSASRCLLDYTRSSSIRTNAYQICYIRHSIVLLIALESCNIVSRNPHIARKTAHLAMIEAIAI
jgi:hypothetical protein